MNELMKTLCHTLYIPLEQVELQSDINSCHHQLTKRLGKLEHELLLKGRIYDREIDFFSGNFLAENLFKINGNKVVLTWGSL